MQLDKNNILALGDILNEAAKTFYNPGEEVGDDTRRLTVVPGEVVCASASLFAAHFAMLPHEEQRSAMTMLHALCAEVARPPEPDPTQPAIRGLILPASVSKAPVMRQAGPSGRIDVADHMPLPAHMKRRPGPPYEG